MARTATAMVPNSCRFAAFQRQIRHGKIGVDAGSTLFMQRFGRDPFDQLTSVTF
jgi:hypothetical protein